MEHRGDYDAGRKHDDDGDAEACPSFIDGGPDRHPTAERAFFRVLRTTQPRWLLPYRSLPIA